MESIRTLIAVFSLFLFIAVLVAQYRLKETIESLDDDVTDAYHKLHYKRSEAALTALEASEENESRFILYQSASDSLERLGTTGSSEAWNSETEAFQQRRRIAMQELCASSHFRACESLGHIYADQGEYESALAAFMISAKNGSFTSMSAIVDLYRTDDWSGKSEEEAKKWLLKIGKP